MNILNELFLERFQLHLTKISKSKNWTQRIINNVLADKGLEDTEFVEKLTALKVDVIRKTYFDAKALMKLSLLEDSSSHCWTFSIFKNKLVCWVMC